MKKLRKILSTSALLVVVSLASVSCTKEFLDVNENPNDPSVSTPSLTLPVALENFASLNATTMNYLGGYMAYQWGVPSNWQANTALLRYTVTSNFYTGIFENSYLGIFNNLTFVENYEDPSGAVDYSAYDVIAQTVKGFQYQYLVDLYGDVPFTEANLRGDNTTPVYDEGEVVYKAVIDSLTNAANLALNLPENAEDPGSADIIFGGDMTSWAQFANTIKLRMLIRMADTGQDQYIQEQIGLIEANGAGYIDDIVAANPGYSDNAGQQNPLWGFLGFEPGTDTETDEHDFTVATDFAIEFLTEKDDPRLESLYAEAENGGYVGVEQAVELPGEGFTSDDLSAVGPGLLKSPDQDQAIMLLSEALLLQAEAVVRGWLPGGDARAQELYEAAIAASFDYLEATVWIDDDDDDETPEVEVPADPSEYYTQSIENVSWEASPDKIEAIITQKWIALNGTSSIENWVEWIRTGYPEPLPVSTASDGARPVSLLYPTSEISRNAENVPDQTADDAFTNLPFWAN